MNNSYFRKEKIKSIKKVKTANKVYDINTKSRTLIVNNIYTHNCAGWSLGDFIKTGFNLNTSFIYSSPPKHLETLLNQINNFIFTLSGEWSGAQALNSVDTYLAPYVKKEGLTYDQVKRSIESLIYNLNCKTRIQMQAPFSNFTFDLFPPKDLKNQKAYIGDEKQSFTYGDCQQEMDIVNKAFIEVMIKGDAKGKPFTFPIPTYNITKTFHWNSEISNLIFEYADESGTPYFNNFINSDLEESDVRSMCCRLRLDKRQLEKNVGGLFGSGDYTGSIGVVTLNLPRMAYLSKKIVYEGKFLSSHILKPFNDLVSDIDNFVSASISEGEDNDSIIVEVFYKMIDYFIDLAKKSLVIKRREVEKNFANGLMPYTKHYLPNFESHFNTIGINGGQEALLNLFGYGIESKDGNKFMQNLLDHLLHKLEDFQEEYADFYKDGKGLLFNLEASPAEGAGSRFAIHDLKDFGQDIVTANGKQLQYYTNSTQMPQDSYDDIFEVLDLQDDLQTKYTSGTVLHIYMNEPVHNTKTVKGLVKKIFENYHLPYISISPNITICPIHGKLPKMYNYCPYNHTKAEIEEIIRRGGEDLLTPE